MNTHFLYKRLLVEVQLRIFKDIACILANILEKSEKLIVNFVPKSSFESSQVQICFVHTLDIVLLPHEALVALL
jgi:hypothetical protein